jgi:hypothetical protein
MLQKFLDQLVFGQINTDRLVEFLSEDAFGTLGNELTVVVFALPQRL